MCAASPSVSFLFPYIVFLHPIQLVRVSVSDVGLNELIECPQKI